MLSGVVALRLPSVYLSTTNLWSDPSGAMVARKKPEPNMPLTAILEPSGLQDACQPFTTLRYPEPSAWATFTSMGYFRLRMKSISSPLGDQDKSAGQEGMTYPVKHGFVYEELFVAGRRGHAGIKQGNVVAITVVEL